MSRQRLKKGTSSEDGGGGGGDAKTLMSQEAINQQAQARAAASGASTNVPSLGLQNTNRRLSAFGNSAASFSSPQLLAPQSNPKLALLAPSISNNADSSVNGSFPAKIHHLLARPESNFESAVTWTSDGKCLRVVDPFKFEGTVAPQYLSGGGGTMSFTSFLIELEKFGFKKVSHEGHSDCYYHEVSYILIGRGLRCSAMPTCILNE